MTRLNGDFVCMSIFRNLLVTIGIAYNPLNILIGCVFRINLCCYGCASAVVGIAETDFFGAIVVILAVDGYGFVFAD